MALTIFCTRFPAHDIPLTISRSQGHGRSMSIKLSNEMPKILLSSLCFRSFCSFMCIAEQSIDRYFTQLYLKFEFPEAVKVAVLIDGNRFAIACTYLRLWNILKINADATIFSFHINETDMMLRSHRMRDAAHLHLHCTSIQECYLRNMLLITCIHRIRNQLLHLFTAAHHRDPRVHNLNDHIAAMTASIKFSFHNQSY